MMRIHENSTTASPNLRLGLALAAALYASACSTSGSSRNAPVETRDTNGFTITENVRVGLGVRSNFNEAMELLEQEKFDEGIALLVKVTEAAPEATTAHIDLAIAYGMVGDLDRAETSLDQALVLNPRHPVAHNEIGIVYRKTGKFDKARASYEEALAIYPDFHFARRNLAILCDLYLADLECAIEHYQAYAKAAPDGEKAAMWIADLQNRLGKE